jgi:hypothetical protein
MKINFSLQIASRQDVINWVSHAWDAVTDDCVENSFKACGISSALDGSEDHLLNDRMADALNAADRQEVDALRDETMGMLFDSEGSDSELDFDGFEQEHGDATDTEVDFDGFSDVNDD